MTHAGGPCTACKSSRAGPCRGQNPSACNSRESSRRSRRLQLKPPSRAHVGGPEIACNRSSHAKSAQGCGMQ
jgi:hypothetical protein